MDGKGIGVGHQCRGERHLFNSNEMYKKGAIEIQYLGLLEH